jgi:hypothetical protein
MNTMQGAAAKFAFFLLVTGAPGPSYSNANNVLGHSHSHEHEPSTTGTRIDTHPPSSSSNINDHITKLLKLALKQHEKISNSATGGIAEGRRRIKNQSRKLEEQESGEEMPELDGKGIGSIVFEKCDALELTGTGRLYQSATFQMCPDNACAGGLMFDDDNGGEPCLSRTMDLSEYLDVALEYVYNKSERMCDDCRDNCYYGCDDDGADDSMCSGDDRVAGDDEEFSGDDGNAKNYYYGDRSLEDTSFCEQCMWECPLIKHMEDNYYKDGGMFAECQMLFEGPLFTLYAGPACASGGSKIKINVFKDEDCLVPDFSKDVEDYLDGFKLSHRFLKQTYDKYDCVDCSVDETHNRALKDDGSNSNSMRMLDQDYYIDGVPNHYCVSLYMMSDEHDDGEIDAKEEALETCYQKCDYEIRGLECFDWVGEFPDGDENLSCEWASVIKEETCTYDLIREKCPKLCGICGDNGDNVTTVLNARDDEPAPSQTSGGGLSRSMGGAKIGGILLLLQFLLF